jgi:hypothetical protein
MWSRGTVREAAAALLAPSLVDEALSAVMPAWRLEATSSPEPHVIIGGRAPLAEDEQWPHNSRGVPLTFIAELDIRRFPPLPDAWPHDLSCLTSGQILRIFGDLLDAPYAPSAALIWPRSDRAMRWIDPPPAPDPWPPGGPADDAAPEHRCAALPRYRANAVPFLTVPEQIPGATVHRDTGWTTFATRVRGEHSLEQLRNPMSTPALSDTLSHVLGYPVSIHDDVRLAGAELYPEVADPDQWSVVLALRSTAFLPLPIFDGGGYHVLVPLEDLRRDRWHRAVLDIATH